MNPPSPFAIFIVTNRRADNVRTIRTLRRCGYSGPVKLVVDDLDPDLAAYRKRYGEDVITFDKRASAAASDSGDNLPELDTVLYARNALWQIARDHGLRHYAVFDDDYARFSHRRLLTTTATRPADAFPDVLAYDLDGILRAFVDFMTTTPTDCLTFAQTGDFIGGHESLSAPTMLRRKAMNTFVLDTEREFDWLGRLNDDVNTYLVHGSRGRLFFTHTDLMVSQQNTQAAEGGLTTAYREHGTYAKSMYSVMMQPSSTRVGLMGNLHLRPHHVTTWRHAVPLILPETARRA